MQGAGAVILIAAIVPPVAYAAVVALLDPRRPRPWLALLASFLWGAAIASTGAALLNDLLSAGLVTAAGEAQARTLAATVGAPVVEELMKGAALLLLLLVRPHLLRSARDGIVHGALVGLGFELAESLDYLTLATVQGGVSGLARAVWVRGLLGGLKHAVFTGTTGAGLGWACEVPHQPRRWQVRLLVPLLALVAAVTQHGAWNAVASHAITRALCGAPAPEAACRVTPAPADLLLSVPLIVVLFVGPGAVALLAIARRCGRA